MRVPPKLLKVLLVRLTATDRLESVARFIDVAVRPMPRAVIDPDSRSPGAAVPPRPPVCDAVPIGARPPRRARDPRRPSPTPACPTPDRPAAAADPRAPPAADTGCGPPGCRWSRSVRDRRCRYGLRPMPAIEPIVRRPCPFIPPTPRPIAGHRAHRARRPPRHPVIPPTPRPIRRPSGRRTAAIAAAPSRDCAPCRRSIPDACPAAPAVTPRHAAHAADERGMFMPRAMPIDGARPAPP